MACPGTTGSRRSRIILVARLVTLTPAKVAELVDAQDLGSCGVTRESSNLSFRTKSELASVASSRWPKARL